MIGSLRGVVVQHIGRAVLFEVGGIGYIISVSSRTQANITSGKEMLFYIYDYVREDARRLFGFESLEERSFFETLISISGVGPKVALLILSVGSLDDIRRAVEKDDVQTLTSLPGVGLKTAQKILLELKGKIVREEEIRSEDRDAVDALVSLGYPLQNAKRAIQEIDPTIQGTQERIRLALKVLSS